MDQHPDGYFLLPWDVSHWMDLVMVRLREESESSGFLKRLIKRSNKLHTMYNRGRGHVEYAGLAKRLGLKALETVTFSTTRFTSSSYDQWEKIYRSYEALITAFIEVRENQDDNEEETKYMIRGQDYAIDLCGTLDVMKPAILLMIKSQAVNLPPWKIVSWLPRVLHILGKINVELHNLRNEVIEIPNEDLLPKLHMHWEEMKGKDVDEEDDNEDDEDEERTFCGMLLYDGWMVVGQETVVIPPVRGQGRGRRETVYRWEARSRNDCLDDLMVLCQELSDGLQTRYDDVLPQSVKDLARIFDLELLIRGLCAFHFEDGQLKIQLEERRQWELCGDVEFANFFKIVCQLPHVRQLLEQSPNLDLLPHSSSIIYRNLKTTLKAMVWHNLGTCADEMFLTANHQPVTEFNDQQLVTMQCEDKPSLHEWFSLTFSSGSTVHARLNEEFITSTFYNNQEVVNSLSQEMCIAIDVAFATSGCEAIVEGFYSVVGAHKKYGGQSNQSLTQRSIVDWCLPHPIRCPETVKEIADIYTKGNRKHSLPKHRIQAFTDERGRAFSHIAVSKVVDRIASESPRCPHVLKEEQ